MLSKTVLCFLLLCLTVTGCINQRSFKTAGDRPRRGTAYTLPPKKVEIGFEGMGQNPENLGGSIGISTGFSKHGEVGINLAHAMFGAVNIYTKYGVINLPHGTLAVGGGLIYLSVQNIWLLSEKQQDNYGKLHILAIPLTLTGSYLFREWLILNFVLGYNHSEVWGTINNKSLFISGAIGGRQLFLRPSINILTFERIHLFIRWRIPMIFRARLKSTATYEIEEGLTLGVRSSDWIQKSPPIAASFVTIGAELKLGKSIRLEIYAMINGAFSRPDLISSPVLPGGGFYWTF